MPKPTPVRRNARATISGRPTRARTQPLKRKPKKEQGLSYASTSYKSPKKPTR